MRKATTAESFRLYKRVQKEVTIYSLQTTTQCHLNTTSRTQRACKVDLSFGFNFGDDICVDGHDFAA